MLSIYQTAKGLLALGLYASSAAGASLQQVSNWGGNPSGLASMHIYVPDKLAANPAIIVGLHPCGGSGTQMYSMTNLPRSADTLGFIMIFPTTTKQSSCWEVNAASCLLHDGGGDSQGVVNMVKYALNKYNGDPNRVYMVGASSGAMMTNVLAATYPDVFEAGAAWSGTPAMCWKGEQSSSPSGPGSKDCANGLKRYTAQEWGDLARSGYPGYTGRRTRMMLVHGTADTLTVYALLGQELAQWSNVLGVSFTRNVTNSPSTNWIKMEYGDATKLVGYSVNGGGHIPSPFQEATILAFFGLTGGSSTTTSRISTTTAMTTAGQTTSQVSTTPTTTPATTRTTTASGAQQTKWGQCGGQGWTGPTTCVSGTTCTFSNNWYSQCL